MKEPKLTYNQLRNILGLAVSNEKIKLTLNDFFSGKTVKTSETEILELIYESGIDLDLISILSGKVLNELDELDATEGVEYIFDFFAYIGANKAKFSGWLATSGYQVQRNLTITNTKGSK